MRFFLLDTIYNSLFCFCSSFAIYRPSFIFSFVRLSISLSLSAEACLVIRQVCACDRSARQSHLSLQSFILIKCFWRVPPPTSQSFVKLIFEKFLDCFQICLPPFISPSSCPIEKLKPDTDAKGTHAKFEMRK